MVTSARVLVVYDSRGVVADLAAALIEGAASVEGVEVWDRPVDEAKQAELLECDALILGSPNWTGMTGKLKHWMDYTGDLWESGELAGKVGRVSPLVGRARRARRRRCSSSFTC